MTTMAKDAPRRPARDRFGLVLLATIALVAGAAAGDQNEAKQMANPIEQRDEMIRLLKSIDARLAELKDVLAQQKH